VSLKKMSTRVEQLLVVVPTKTKDNVFVQVVCAVQLVVREENPMDAIYKLEDVGVQLDSYVSDIVRSQLPKMLLDDAFHAKDEISRGIQDALVEKMAEFGWTIIKALVIDFRVNDDVVRAMNEINKQARLRDASIMAAEADKIRTVKAAEADADATSLKGEGIARQRSAIIDGLRASLTATTGNKVIPQEDITTLLLTTQYFETLKNIGSHPTSKTYFLPSGDDEDVDAQVRSGMLQGQAALEFLMQGGRNSESRAYQPPPMPSNSSPPQPNFSAPPQEMFQPPPTQSQPPQQSMQQPQSVMDRVRARAMEAARAAEEMARQLAEESDSSDSEVAQPPPQRAPPGPPVRQQMRLQIQVPPGLPPGGQLQVQAPNGQMVLIQVPPGVQPGQVLEVAI